MTLETRTIFQTFPAVGAFTMRQGMQSTCVRVDGVMELIELFDVFLFSAENTLISNGMATPNGAILIPHLRKKGKRVGVFSLEERASREEITNELNRVGLSFTDKRILLRKDLSQLHDRFPFAARNRILGICSDAFCEVPTMQSHLLSTLLVQKGGYKNSETFGIQPDFISTGV